MVTPDLEQLLQQALKLARKDHNYRFVACYLKAALETARECKEMTKSS